VIDGKHSSPGVIIIVIINATFLKRKECEVCFCRVIILCSANCRHFESVPLINSP